MCIFVSASCIYATDVDDVIESNNQGSIDINALDDGTSEVTTDIGNDADDSSNAIDTISDDAHHHKKPKRDIDSEKAKPSHIIDYKKHANNTTDEKPMHHHKHVNRTEGEMIMFYHMVPNDWELAGFSSTVKEQDTAEKETSANTNYIQEHTSDKNSKKTIPDNMEKIWNLNNNPENQISATNQLALNFTDPVEKTMDSESKLTREEFSCYKDDKYNLNITVQNNNKIITDNNFNNNPAYSYNCYTQTTNPKSVVFNLRDSNEGEIIGPRNRNFKNILSLNYNLELGQINDGNTLNEYNNNMNTSDLSINYTDSDLNYNRLKIALDSAELNIKDYNLEYYIFTNPYIIINISVENNPFNNDISSRCFNAHQTIAPTMNQNNSISNIETIFKQELIENHITGYDYDVGDCTLNTANFCKTAFQLELYDLRMIDDNVLRSIEFTKLSNNHCAEVTIPIGAYERCQN